MEKLDGAMADTRDSLGWFGYLCIGLMAGTLALLTYGMVDHIRGPTYMRHYVSIDSASGLDLPPSKDLVLDPRFNLTLHLASSRLGHPVCMDAGTYVAVSYRCVPLATSHPTPHHLCVGAEKNSSSISMPIVARGTGVQLPGYMMDDHVVDLRSGVEAFGVTLMMSGDHFLASCGFRRVDDAAVECCFMNACPHN